MNCGQGDEPNAVVNSPGICNHSAPRMTVNSDTFISWLYDHEQCGRGTSITSSTFALVLECLLTAPAILSQLHAIYDNVYRGMDSALSHIALDVGTFVSALSPIVEDIAEQVKLKLILDGVQLGLTLLIAPSLHLGLTKTAWVAANPNRFGTGVDITYGLLGTSSMLTPISAIGRTDTDILAVGFVKDSLESLSTTPVTNTIANYIGNTANTWAWAMSNGTKVCPSTERCSSCLCLHFTRIDLGLITLPPMLDSVQ